MEAEDERFLNFAIEQAEEGRTEGGIPIGAGYFICFESLSSSILRS
jgi:hypothetical protein